MKESGSSFTVEITETENTACGRRGWRQKSGKRKNPVLSCEGGAYEERLHVLRPTWWRKKSHTGAAAMESSLPFPTRNCTMDQEVGKIVLIDGCFLRCHGRILENLIGEENLIQFDALSFYKKYTDLFDIDSVSEEERKETARLVADNVLANLKTTSGCDVESQVRTECGAEPQRPVCC